MPTSSPTMTAGNLHRRHAWPATHTRIGSQSPSSRRGDSRGALGVASKETRSGTRQLVKCRHACMNDVPTVNFTIARDRRGQNPTILCAPQLSRTVERSRFTDGVSVEVVAELDCARTVMPRLNQSEDVIGKFREPHPNCNTSLKKWSGRAPPHRVMHPSETSKQNPTRRPR